MREGGEEMGESAIVRAFGEDAANVCEWVRREFAIGTMLMKLLAFVQVIPIPMSTDRRCLQHREVEHAHCEPSEIAVSNRALAHLFAWLQELIT